MISRKKLVRVCQRDRNRINNGCGLKLQRKSGESHDNSDACVSLHELLKSGANAITQMISRQ
jgi:hypothetical protein